MNAVAYTRLSSHDQSNYSLDAQERSIREYCIRNDLKLLSIFTDNGESSYSFDRPDFIELEKFLKQQRNIEYLIVFHCDRFSRNLAEALTKIKELEKKFRINIRTVQDPLDIDFTDPANFMKRAFEFMLAEHELHRIHERTRTGMRQAALAGRFTRPAPFGYVNARDEHNKPILHIDEEKAVIVRMIFREFLNGMGIASLHKLARRYGFNLNGNSAIVRILTYPVYMGYIQVKAYKKESARLVKGLHSPIISEQDYWLAQSKLAGKSIGRQNRDEVPLRGILRGRSGRFMTAMNARSKSGRYYWYYQEQDNKKIYPANRLHDLFYRILDELTFDSETLRAFKEDTTAKLQTALGERGDKKKELRSQLTMIDKRIENVETKYLTKPDISEAVFNRVIGELRADKARLQKGLADLNTSHQQYWNHLNELLLKLSDLRTAFTELPLHKKHQFINTVFCNELSYYDDTYKTPGLNKLFRHNELKLKEKGLLVIAAPVIKIGISPVGTPGGSDTKHGLDGISDFQQFAEIFFKTG